MKQTITTGIRGCCAKTKRRGTERYCAQPYVVIDSKTGEQWCWYHTPNKNRKFGSGYRDEESGWGAGK